MVTTLRARLARLIPQPIVALVMTGLGSAVLCASWAGSGLAGINPGGLLLAALLACWVAGSYLFPIHIGRCQKVEMTTVSIYLMAVLLPTPTLASTAAGLGILAGELLVRAPRGNLYSDVSTAVSRWVIVVLAGAEFFHMSGGLSTFSLIGVAAALWAVDVLTNPLVIAPMTGERPLRFLVGNIRTSALVDGVQYLLGLLGALAALV